MSQWTPNARCLTCKRVFLPLIVLLVFPSAGSMNPWISAAKRVALKTANEIRSTMGAGVKYRLGFVGYRDYSDADRFVVIPFTEDVQLVEARLMPISASGGADEAEDVAGGLRKALDQNWTATTKIIIHVADAPPHGMQFHKVTCGDNYPGGDKDGLDPITLIKEAAVMEIDYYFVKCNASTDVMIEKLYEGYKAVAAPGQQFVVMDLAVQPGTTDSSSTIPRPVPHSRYSGSVDDPSPVRESGRAMPKTRMRVMATMDRYEESFAAPRAAAAPSLLSRMFSGSSKPCAPAPAAMMAAPARSTAARFESREEAAPAEACDGADEGLCTATYDCAPCAPSAYASAAPSCAARDPDSILTSVITAATTRSMYGSAMRRSAATAS